MSKRFMNWREMNGLEKVAVVVTVVGLSGSVAILLSGHPLIAFVVALSTVVEFALLGKAEKRRVKDE